MQQDMANVREPAVADAFYPGDPAKLEATVDGLLAKAAPLSIPELRALVVPHAGYVYSGPTAAVGFRQVQGLDFNRVVVLAPSHRVAFRGVAVPRADGFRTPLGVIPVSPRASKLGQQSPFVLDSRPHASEHSLEVELPFLQRTLKRFELIPLVFGDVDEAEVARKLEALVEPRTLFVASTDLSHFHPYDRAKALDESTMDAIVRLDTEAVASAEACGRSPVLALVHLARSLGWKARRLEYKNSGDTVGDRSRVVGYTSIVFTQDNS